VAEPTHETFMRRALVQAYHARDRGEVPIGAVLVRGTEVLAEAYNQPIASSDPTAHAEVIVLRDAARRSGNYRLPGSTLYVTVEPCLMCVGALVNARVERLVYGPDEPKFGAVRSLVRLDDVKVNHRVEVVAGILAEECRELLVEFFRSRRDRPSG
jgi:tRNA(adenine34) deaminase